MTYCRLKEITHTQSQTFGNFSGVLRNASDNKQIPQMAATTGIAEPKNLPVVKPSRSDLLSLENEKIINDKGINTSCVQLNA